MTFLKRCNNRWLQFPSLVKLIRLNARKEAWTYAFLWARFPTNQVQCKTQGTDLRLLRNPFKPSGPQEPLHSISLALMMPLGHSVISEQSQLRIYKNPKMVQP